MELRRVYQTEKKEGLPKVINNYYSNNSVKTKKNEKIYSILHNYRITCNKY